jgi:methanogenic corrinoid protein MtbC1
MKADARRCAEILRGQETDLAEGLVARHFAAHPELNGRYGPSGRLKCLEDARLHLAFLVQAVEFDRPELFVRYVAWAKVMLSSRGIPPSDLSAYLSLLRDVVRERLPPEAAGRADAVLHDALLHFPDAPLDVASFLDGEGPLADLARNFLALLQRGERQQAGQQVLAAVEAGTSVRDIYIEVFQRVQHEVGRLWQLNLISVAQEHYCTAATQTIMSQLYPRIFTGRPSVATLVATCVAGNVHEIGVRMLSDLFELEGWRTFFLGSNTPTAAVLDIVEEHRADVLAISAALAFDLGAVRDLIERLRAERRFDHVRVLVGGSVFDHSPNLWRDVGADGYAPSADAAVGLAKRWIAAVP